MTKKPIIGIIPDYKKGSVGSYSKYPFYAIRENYLQMISGAGAAPLVFSYDYEAITDYLNLIDGLVFIGGGFDVDPKRYGEELHPQTTLNHTRDNFEYQFLSSAIQQKPNLPILGICNGMQLINIFFGGSCIQHIGDHQQYSNHEQSRDPEYADQKQPYHQVKIDQNSHFFKIVGEEIIKTNSSHHQAVGRLGTDIKVCATALDGIIEAVEHQKHPFCLGVQWHPEFYVSAADKKIFSAFIKACKN